MRQRFDIAIVGSGPAGAACALRLARAGFTVALIDEATFPRRKLCGDYLNLGAIGALRDLGIDEPLASKATPIAGMRLFAHDTTAEFCFPEHAWSLPRIVLDAHIRTAALEAGATPVRGRVCKIEQNPRRVYVELDGHGERVSIEAAFLVGADGIHSKIARLCNLAAQLQGDTYATGGHYADVGAKDWLEMYVTPRGYLALNPLKGSSANAMFVLPREHFHRARHALGKELTRFASEASGGSRCILEDQLKERRLAVGPLQHHAAAFSQDRVLLVGDAAAFVDPFTGQGVFLALSGAKLAAETIARALTRERDRHSLQSRYERVLHGIIRDRERIATLVRIILANRSASKRVARALSGRPDNFAPLIEAACGLTSISVLHLTLNLARALH